MKTQHTPGPWFYRPDRHDDWGLVKDADGMPVATANMSARHPAEKADYVPGVGFPEPPEITANGILITAAPDHALLLAALVSGRAHMTRLGKHKFSPDDRAELVIDGKTLAVVPLDPYGCPILTDALRAALTEAGEAE